MTSMPFCFRPSGQSVRVMPVSVMLMSLTRVDLLRVRRTIPRTCGGDVSSSECDVASKVSFSDGDTWLCACKKTAGSVTASATLYERMISTPVGMLEARGPWNDGPQKSDDPCHMADNSPDR